MRSSCTQLLKRAAFDAAASATGGNPILLSYCRLPDLPDNCQPWASGWRRSRVRRSVRIAAERTFVTAIIVEQHSAGNLADIGIPREAKMNDRYTKAVLTVIAVALTVIAARDWLPIKPATAQNGPVRVIIEGVEPYAFQGTTVPVRVANYW